MLSVTDIGQGRAVITYTWWSFDE